MADYSPTPANWDLYASRDPPVYTRCMVGSELAMHKYWSTFDRNGQVCVGLNFISSLGIEELKVRGRNALDKLRFVCPAIACTTHGDLLPRWVYTPSADREAWLDLAFVVEDRGTSLNIPAFIQAIDFKRLPIVDERGTTTIFRAYLLTTTSVGEDGSREYGLYFHAPHSIMDGGPAFHALNLMCEWISGGGMDVTIDPLEEWKHLPVDPVTATGGPCPEWATCGPKLLQVFAEQKARTTPCHTIAPPSRSSNISDPPVFCCKTVSESDTAAIVAAAKKLGVSVSSLFHAAYSLAHLKMNPFSASTMQVDFSSDATVVALERYFKPPVDPRTHFISSFTLVPLRFSMTEPLKERSERARLIVTAKTLQERFDTYLANPCLPQLLAVKESMLPSAEAKRLCDLVPQAEGGADGPTLPPWSCAFNNLGVIENRLRTRHGALTVVGIGVGNRLRNFLTVHMWTMHSKLHFQIQGASAWGEERMETMLEEIVRIAFLVLDSDQES